MQKKKAAVLLDERCFFIISLVLVLGVLYVCNPTNFTVISKEQATQLAEFMAAIHIFRSEKHLFEEDSELFNRYHMLKEEFSSCMSLLSEVEYRMVMIVFRRKKREVFSRVKSRELQAVGIQKTARQRQTLL
jgi:hypothetical protein